MVDTNRSYNLVGGKREYYFNKYLSACMMTFTPVKNLGLSIGNSVVSCSKNYNPAYLSPFLFYSKQKYPGDSLQQLQYGQNSQFFLNVSSRQIRHLHLFGTLFMDNFKSSDLSWKVGLHLDDLPVRNLYFTAEYTMTTPNTYTDPVSTLTFESNNFVLGSYLKDDSREIFVDLGYKPFRGFDVHVSWENQQHASDYASQAITAAVQYEFINNAFVFIQYMNRNQTKDIGYVPDIFQLTTNTIMAGFNIGF